MKKKKLILFDWGNIVESHEKGYTCPMAWDDLFLRCGYTGEKHIYGNLFEYKLSALKTEKELEKMYYKIKEDFNLNTDYKEFKKIYLEIFDKVDAYEDVKEFEHSLSDICYIGVLSNLNILDYDRINKQLELEKYDYVFLSYELGIKKPAKELFEKVQKKLPFKKENILFIDDTERNIIAAKEFGWNAVHLTGLELDKIKNACYKFLNIDKNQK